MYCSSVRGIGIGGGEAAERFLDLGFGPLRQFAVRGFGIGFGARLAVFEGASGFAFGGRLQALPSGTVL